MTGVKGTGKGKAVKVKQETLPTPQGRRVVPRVTSTMKAEANRKADLKKGEGKRGRKIKVSLLKFSVCVLTYIYYFVYWGRSFNYPDCQKQNSVQYVRILTLFGTALSPNESKILLNPSCNCRVKM